LFHNQGSTRRKFNFHTKKGTFSKQMELGETFFVDSSWRRGGGTFKRMFLWKLIQIPAETL